MCDGCCWNRRGICRQLTFRPALLIHLSSSNSRKPMASNPSLLPAEAFVLSRINGPTTVNELLSVSGMNEEETLQSLYALAICGVVKRAAWATPQFNGSAGANAAVKSEAVANDKIDTLEDFFGRAELAVSYYDLLGVGHQANADEVKNAYHSLARRYHPGPFPPGRRATSQPNRICLRTRRASLRSAG